MSAAAIAAGVRAGELRAEDVVAGALERLAAQPQLNAVITLCEESALARARAGVAGRLAGVPLLVKDLIDTAGIRTTYASAIHRDHVPARTAPAVAALEAEGAIVVGKANADEFAWGVCGQNEHWGDMANPRRPGRIAGGSSGGNATALAAGMVPLALGTDTGGSVRLPAAACGVVGLKPPLGASRSRASSRSPRASTRSGRWRAAPRTACWPTRCSRGRPSPRRASRGCASAC